MKTEFDLDTQTELALDFFKKGDLVLAKDLCYTNLSKNASHAPSLNLLGIILFKEGFLEKSIENLKKAILNTTDKVKDYTFNLAKIYHASKQLQKAAETYQECCEYTTAADLFFFQNNLNHAKTCLYNQIKLNDLDAQSYNKLGVILSIQENYTEAKTQFETSIKLDSSNAQAYNNLGSVFHKLKEYQLSIINFEKSISLNPNYAEAYNHLGTVLSDLEMHEDSQNAFEKAILINPKFAEAHFNLGNLFIKLNQVTKALSHLEKAIEINPSYFESYLELGRSFRALRNEVKSIEYFQKASEIDSNSLEVNTCLMGAYQGLCDWENHDKFKQILDNHPNKNTFEEPFRALSRTMDLKHLLKVVEQVALKTKNASESRKKLYQFDTPSINKKIHIGYLSSDFHDHATSHLFTGVLEHHSKEAFEISIYSYGIDDQSGYRKRIINASNHFHDVRHLKNYEIADKIYQDKIDILVDLKGYTQGARLEICALKPAPIQITYLGFPGTSGADFFDYIIADKVVLPIEHLSYYTEKPIYMPHTYQSNDDKQQVSPNIYTKSDCYLPEDHFIFCSFNQSYKIEKIMFDSWMNILKRVPKSSLWLLKCQDKAMENLRSEALKRGIDPSRLIFADLLKKDLHLSRLRNADLMLDTRIYNGHTTTSDALFMNVPVITVEGSHFASRVSSSLLQALDLKELVCHSQQEFETLAIEIATNCEYHKGLKDKISKNKQICPLYNTRKFTLDLEARYKKAFESYINGQKLEIIE